MKGSTLCYDACEHRCTKHVCRCFWFKAQCRSYPLKAKACRPAKCSARRVVCLIRVLTYQGGTSSLSEDASAAHAVIVVGTSISVQPAAMIPSLCKQHSEWGLSRSM